ncbi:MAG: site-specific integrase [Oscillospiraceae bacterium]|jgi:integrase|nr:site-specific integrase [Oscillospiraceae bacterium]
MISKNPFEHVEMPQMRQNEVVHLSQHELLALLDALPDTTHGCCCELILWTGLRKSEVAGLEWQDVDFNEGVIYVKRTKQYLWSIENGVKADHQALDVRPTKSKKGFRRIPMKPETRKLFERQLAEQKRERLLYAKVWTGGYPGAPNMCVFATHVGTVPDMANARKTLRRACSEAETKLITLHPLRHSCLTAIARGGKVDLRTLAELAGHEKPSFTAEKYMHSDPFAMSDALDVLGERLKKTSKRRGKV